MPRRESPSHAIIVKVARATARQRYPPLRTTLPGLQPVCRPLRVLLRFSRSDPSTAAAAAHRSRGSACGPPTGNGGEASRAVLNSKIEPCLISLDKHIPKCGCHLEMLREALPRC